MAFAQTVPRTASGKPDFQGIWQVQNRASYNVQSHTARYDMLPGMGVVVDDEIPYQPWALEQKNTNFVNRKTVDPLSNGPKFFGSFTPTASKQCIPG